jgi:sugar phosphate isomerase/epimerase
MISRRDFAAAWFGSAALACSGEAQPTKTAAVPLGVQTYSFHLLPPEGARERIIRAMTAIGIPFCEITSIHLQPAEITLKMLSSDPAIRTQAAKDFRRWKLSVPIGYFAEIRNQFQNAGLAIRSCSIDIGETDEEIERTFAIAKGLGAGMFSTATRLSIAKRTGAIVRRHDLRVGFQGRFNAKATDPDLMATPEKLLEVLTYSDRFYLQLDIGDCTGAGFDALPLVESHYDRLSGVHLKDKTRSGRSMPFGQGDTPIKPVLEFLKGKQAGIPAYIDCDYRSEQTPEDQVKRNFAYAKGILA